MPCCKGKSGPGEERNRTPRREQGRPDPGVDRALQGSDLGRDPEDHRMAGAQRARLPVQRRQEALPHDRVDQNGGRRSRLSLMWCTT
jgi:hypothetical protein